MKNQTASYIFCLGISLAFVVHAGEVGESEPGRSAGEVDGTCVGFQEEFRSYLLTQVKALKADFNHSYNCYSGGSINSFCTDRRNKINDVVVRHGVLLRKLRQEIFKTWFEKNPAKNAYASCLKRDGSGQPILGRNSRILEVTDPLRCEGLVSSFRDEMDQLFVAAVNDPGPTGTVSADEKAELLSFSESPIGKNLGQDIVSNETYSPENRNKELLKVFSSLKSGATTLERKIERLPQHELYKLYAFGNKYVEFAGTLGYRTEKALQCMAGDSYFKDCFGDKLASCASKTGDFLTGVVPFVSTIDACMKLPLNRAAYDAGISNASEYAAGVATLGVQGIAGLFASGGLVKGFAKNLGIKAAGIGVAQKAAVKNSSVVIDRLGRSAGSLLDRSDYYFGPGTKGLRYVFPPDNIKYPLVVEKSEIQSIKAIADGAKVEVKGYGQYLVDEVKHQLKDLGSEAQGRISSALNAPEIKIGSRTLKVVNPTGGKVRLPLDAEMTAAPTVENNVMYGSQYIKVAAKDGKVVRYYALDTPGYKAEEGVISQATNLNSINGMDVRIMSKGKLISGKYLSAGGRDLPRGASPNHFAPSEVEAHFIQVGEDVVVVPAEDARIFVQP